MKKLLLSVVVMSSALAFAGPPKGGPGKWAAMEPEERAERREERAKAARMMLLVSVVEALELNDAQALKLAEKLKVLDEKRRPVREGMGEAMRQVKAASDGDSAALAAIDANVQKVLDGRAQLALLDKELYLSLAEGQTPQKKAKLAVVLAKVHGELRGMHGNKGRHRRE